MGAEVAAHRRGGRLVEKREPLVDLARLDVRPTLAGEREHLDVAIADARRELVRLVEERAPRRRVALPNSALRA